MANELTLKLLSKWRVSGASAAAQGADGVGQLAATAYAAMTGSEWAPDPDPATMPVHEFNRDRPSGQAYKAVWGYDAKARTERSCCGAECYTFALPADAFSGTPAAVEAVTAPVVVDRYCDEGVRVLAVQSADAIPPALADALTLSGWSAALYATKTQTDSSGNPLRPNDRHGDGGTATFPVVAGEGGGYLHLFLVMADYLGVRGAWIEGGAMFGAESAVVSFDRAVTPDAAPVSEVVLLQSDRERGASGSVQVSINDDDSSQPCAYQLLLPPNVAAVDGSVNPATFAEFGLVAESRKDGGTSRYLSAGFDVVSLKDIGAFLGSDFPRQGQSAVVGMLKDDDGLGLYLGGLVVLPLWGGCSAASLLLRLRVPPCNQGAAKRTARVSSIGMRVLAYAGSGVPRLAVSTPGGVEVSAPRRSSASSDYYDPFPASRLLATAPDPWRFPYWAGDALVSGASVQYAPVGYVIEPKHPDATARDAALAPDPAPDNPTPEEAAELAAKAALPLIGAASLRMALEPVAEWRLPPGFAGTTDSQTEADLPGHDGGWLRLDLPSPASFAPGSALVLLLMPTDTAAVQGNGTTTGNSGLDYVRVGSNADNGPGLKIELA